MKGVVSNALTPLESLAGLVLKKSFVPPPIPAPAPEIWTTSGYIQQLHQQVDCIWQIYLSLAGRDSVGLRLMQSQAQQNGYPVTLFQGDKPVAEGSIIWPCPSYIEVLDSEEGTRRHIRITKTRSLIMLTQVLIPGCIHALHSQCIQWIYEHGQQAVVTTSTLRSRAVGLASSSHTSLHHALLSPAPPSYSLDEQNISPLTLSIPDPGQPFSQVPTQEGNENLSENFENEGIVIDEHDDASEFFGEERQFRDVTATDNIDSININEKLPSRVLDDAFHFQDRLARLLPKKHSAFSSFMHDFSEAIFIRDKNDVTAVRAVLESKGINWDYAVRAKASVLNRRIRRYIPPRSILVDRLKILFDGYKDIICSKKSGRSRPFFSKDANEMAQRLLETARRGFLSDPPGISLYYKMLTDKDGLTIYRTIRGTNSVEGGVHMAVRRVFGSLQASPELAKCLLLNWILRRNCKVCLLLIV